MALFKKKKDEDPEEEEDFDEEEDGERRKPLRRKFLRNKDFRDLNPTDKKYRKEPPKPWGKKERILLLLFIVLTAGTSGFLALSSRDWKLPGLPRLKMPSISLPSFFREETIIIEGDPKNKSKEQRTLQAFAEKTGKLSGVYGLYVLRLSDRSSFGVNEKEVFQAASLIKLPVMAGMYLESEKGNINLDTKYKLKNSDKREGSGSLSAKPAGYEITYRNLIKLMGKESDNTAFNICRKLLGDEKIAEIIKSIGMKKMNIETNETTPEDVGIFFDELWEGNVIGQKDKEELLGFMTQTIYEKWLAAGVPDTVRVAHKFGRDIHVVNDAGIIYTKKPVVVVIMSKGIVETEADSVFPDISRSVYEIESED